MSVYRGMKPIDEKLYVNSKVDWEKIKISLPQYLEQLNTFNECIDHGLVKTNEAIIRKIAALLDIKTKIVLDAPSERRSTERLIEICTQQGATKYLSGIGGKKYLDEAPFKKKDIELTYQNETDMIKKNILEVIKNVR